MMTLNWLLFEMECCFLGINLEIVKSSCVPEKAESLSKYVSIELKLSVRPECVDISNGFKVIKV